MSTQISELEKEEKSISSINPIIKRACGLNIHKDSVVATILGEGIK